MIEMEPITLDSKEQMKRISQKLTMLKRKDTCCVARSIVRSFFCIILLLSTTIKGVQAQSSNPYGFNPTQYNTKLLGAISYSFTEQFYGYTYYKFTANGSFPLYVSNCGTGSATTITLFSEAGYMIRTASNSNDYPSHCTGPEAVMFLPLNANTTYYVRVEVSGTGSGSLATKFFPPPSVPTCQLPLAPSQSADATTICSGGGTTLRASGENIRWYRSGSYIGVGNTIWIVSSGSYYAASSNSCGETNASSVMNITQSSNSLPAAPILSTNKFTICSGEIATLTSSIADVTWHYYGSEGNRSFYSSGYTVNVSSPGTYTASKTNECGTSNSQNGIEIKTGSSVPAAPILSGGGSVVCYGTATHLSATGVNITWYLGNTQVGSGNDIWVYEPGHYYAYSSNSCGRSSASSATQVQVLYEPVVPTISISGNTFLCDNEAIILSAASAGTISWYHNGNPMGVSESNVEVNVAGSYTATLVS